DIAVFRPSTSTWLIPGRPAVQWGLRGDIPLTGDFSGAGHTDFAVYRPSNRTWYVYGAGATSFGSPGISPLGAAPYRG
ncbi:MAG TPA: hypothetical protein VHO01_09085, partial [Jatrophihabitans sp.]|nr:hypothetical protein [Jatrophihabitans sp.]